MGAMSGEDLKLAMQVVLGVCLFISELLPFIGSHDYNGILHFLARKMKLCSEPQSPQQRQQQQNGSK